MRGSTYGLTWPAKTDHRVDSGSFFGKLRSKTKNGLIFDLPTEAQWEMAARDKGDGTYHGSCVWNDGTTFLKEVETNGVVQTVADFSDVLDLAWCGQNAGGAAHEVGLKEPGLNGLYDMHGNLWEWCLDPYIYFLGNDPVVDPVGGTEISTSHVRRGGCYYSTDPLHFCRMALRFSWAESRVDSTVGFRIVLLP